jgi:parallel beta-helix repeat protein
MIQRRLRNSRSIRGFTVLALASAALLASASVALAQVATDAEGRPVLCVQTEGDAGCYSSVQAAVDSAEAGATVFVMPGTYQESVEIAKALTLRGAGREVTTIDAAGADNVVHIAADGVRVEGFTLTGSRLDGVLVNANQFEVVSNTLTGNATLVIPPAPNAGPGALPTVFNNINLQNASWGLVANNTIANSNGRGIRTEGSAAYNAPDFGVVKVVMGRSDHNVIRNNDIHDNHGGCGIVLSTDSSNNLVSGNTVRNNETGLVVSNIPPFGLPNTPFANHIPHSDGNIIVDNILENNPTEGIGIHPIVGTAMGNIVARNIVRDNGPCPACDNHSVGIYVFAGSMPPSASADNVVGPGNVVTGQEWGIFVGGGARGTQVFANEVSVKTGGIPVNNQAR